jgi:predicted alpha/beta-hydrolase family hydrolase
VADASGGRDEDRSEEATGPAGAVLFPGAGSSRDHSTLVALEAALRPRPGVRADLPKPRAGRRAPDRAPVLVATVVEESRRLADLLAVGSERLLLGGRSMGGRMASMAVAEGLPAWGLLLLSYPLHPPGRPDRPRTAHLPALDLPTLFVSGTRDPFGSVAELEAAAAMVPGPAAVHRVEGAGHELGRSDPEVVAAVTAWLDSLGASGPAASAASPPA